VLAPRVVEKVAAQAAGEVEEVFGLARQLAGRRVGAERVRVQADLDGLVAAIRVELALVYPGALLAVTRRVREHVAGRVQQLCGVRVSQVDITVAALHHQMADRRRVQ